MTLLRNKTVLALCIVALVQTGALAGMVIDRVRLLKTGREITLPVVPVDPRDLFRGEYVRLGYEAARLPVRLLEGPPPHRNDAFYVTLDQRKEDGSWHPVRITRTWPDEKAPDRIVLKARSVFSWPAVTLPTSVVQARYGIESYFVPQGEGPRLEALARDKKLAARIAVDSKGNAAIKGIIIDGKLQYEEPLF